MMSWKHLLARVSCDADVRDKALPNKKLGASMPADDSDASESDERATCFDALIDCLSHHALWHVTLLDAHKCGASLKVMSFWLLDHPVQSMQNMSPVSRFPFPI